MNPLVIAAAAAAVVLALSATAGAARRPVFEDEPPAPGGERVVVNVPGLSDMSPAFQWELTEVARRGGLNAGALALVMKRESGFDPSIRNPRGGATGLIQFMPKTATMLGTTTDALAAMTPFQQLQYVEAFYQYAAPRGLRNVGDHYIATFWPAALGKPDSYVISRRGEKVYEVNAVLDRDKDGTITAGDVRALLEVPYRRYEARAPLIVRPARPTAADLGA